MNDRRAVAVTSFGVAAVVTLAAVLAVAILAAPSPASAHGSPLTPATGAPRQWAFGGSASINFGCSGASCHSGSLGANENLTLSYKYYIGWVVIYTETNISANQTQIEGQAALNASVSAALSTCISPGHGSPCQNSSLSLSLSGQESAVGFTNITNGTLEVTDAVGFQSAAFALAVLNAHSQESYNFSGSYGAHIVNASGTTNEGASFDFGGSEDATLNFVHALSIVPVAPLPGDSWSASEPYTASGGYTTGYTISLNLPQNVVTEANWTHGNVASAGNLSVDGTDLGSATLWDNYTSPPTSVTAQAILLEFGNGNWTASDGFLMIPVSVYGGLSSGLSGASAVARMAPALATRPGQSAIPGSNGESAYYEKGVGFVGANSTGSTSSLTSGVGVSGPSIHLTAGPEPVSVAQQQYGAILSSNGGSSGGFPWIVLVLAVVVILVIVVGLVAWRRSHRPPPPAASPPGAAPMGAVPRGAGSIWTPAGPAPPPPPPPAM
jgi:hypothetical protein